MRLYPWLILIGLIVLLRQLVAALPMPNLPGWGESNGPLGINPFKGSNPGGCQVARPAVVTIFAGKEIGSGSVLTGNGLVLTNHHVIREAPDHLVWVRTFAGQRYRGRVLATDRMNDLALVQLAAANQLPTIQFAPTVDLPAGQAVCAIGSPFGKTGILSRGVVTGVRGNGDLQTQMLLHPGNSGGPLLNQRGELIGVNKSIWLSDTGENSGISFATNGTVAQTFVAQHQEKGTPIAQIPLPMDPTVQTQPEPLGYRGAPVQQVPVPAPPPNPTGVRLGVIIKQENLRVQIVEPNSPAEQAGINAGDLLIAINGKTLQNFEELRQFLSSRPGQATFTVRRPQGIQDIQVQF